MNTISRLHRFLANAAARMPRPMIVVAQVAVALAFAAFMTACPHH